MRALNYLGRAARRLLADEDGVTTVEYAVLVALVVLACAAGAAAFRAPAGSVLDASTNSIGTYPDP